MEIEREESGTVLTGVIGTSIGPLAGDGLDEAFGLAIGLRAIGSGEEMLEAQLVAGGGKEFGAISGSPIGEDPLDGDVMGLVKSNGLMECGQDAGSFFIWEEAGKSEAGVVINGDVQAFDSGARIAVGTVAGGADAGLMKAAKFFNIKMKEFAWGGAFVTEGRRFGWFEGTEAVEAVALEDA
jgi:hypothetical protein